VTGTRGNFLRVRVRNTKAQFTKGGGRKKTKIAGLEEIRRGPQPGEAIFICAKASKAGRKEKKRKSEDKRSGQHSRAAFTGLIEQGGEKEEETNQTKEPWAEICQVKSFRGSDRGGGGN